MVQRSLLPLPVDLESSQRVRCQLLIASVVFGQSSLGCLGNGICKVDMVTSNWPSPIDTENNFKNMCIGNLVEISRNAEMTMRFTIYNHSLNPMIRAKYFSSDFFEVKEIFRIPAHVVKTLDLKNDKVSIGTYDIKKMPNALIIDF